MLPELSVLVLVLSSSPSSVDWVVAPLSDGAGAAEEVVTERVLGLLEAQERDAGWHSAGKLAVV